jgi:hypothetical protein
VYVNPRRAERSPRRLQLRPGDVTRSLTNDDSEAEDVRHGAISIAICRAGYCAISIATLTQPVARSDPDRETQPTL